MKGFGDWLEERIKEKGMKPADLTHEANVGTGTIYNILNNNRKPGLEVILAIAHALNLPAEEVFRQAGFLPPKPKLDAESEEALHLFRQLSPEIRHLILKALRVWVETTENHRSPD